MTERSQPSTPTASDHHEPNDEQYVAIQVMMLPRDTNAHGTIFGGLILSHIDLAGAIAARREVIRAGGPPPTVVTVAINRVEFKQPVHVGDVVSFRTSLVRFGRTSVTIRVCVIAERGTTALHVTEAEVVYVGVGPDGTPTPLFGPG